MTTRDSRPVRTALRAMNDARVDAQRPGHNDASIRIAARKFYAALSNVLQVYAKQFSDESGLPVATPLGTPPESFPPEAAYYCHSMLEGFLVGHMDNSLRDIIERPGAPGRSLGERRAIEDACRYMQAASGSQPLIADRSPVKRIAEWFGVDRSTAQSWRRAESRDLVVGYILQASDFERARMIERRARDSGRRFARHGRGHQAIRHRAKKGV
jgi:hypothetical protein